MSRSTSAVFPPTVGNIAIHLCRDPVDFRLGINGLSVLVEATLKYDLFSQNLFCFVNKRKNQIKVLYWQRTGVGLWQKRLEEERFRWLFHLEGPVVELDEDQFFWLLEGLDLKHLKPHRALEYRTVVHRRRWVTLQRRAISTGLHRADQTSACSKPSTNTGNNSPSHRTSVGALPHRECYRTI